MYKQLFTPKINRHSDERLKLYLNEEDSRNTAGRGRWKATVTDIVTNIKYKVAGCSCGAPYCMCDAYVVEIIN